jgi:hypothetical protein
MAPYQQLLGQMCGFFCVALAWIGDGWVAFQLMPKRLQKLLPHCRESPENKKKY